MKLSWRAFEIGKQWAEQRKRALMLKQYGGVEQPLHIMLTTYRDDPARVSIIGNAISYAAPELWEQNGARCFRLEVI